MNTDSYGDGNVYRCVRSKDSEIETVIVNRCCPTGCVDEFKRLRAERDALKAKLASIRQSHRDAYRQEE